MMKRKVKAFLLALMLLSCMGLSANVVVAQPRAILCDCGGTMVVQDSVWQLGDCWMQELCAWPGGNRYQENAKSNFL